MICKDIEVKGIDAVDYQMGSDALHGYIDTITHSLLGEHREQRVILRLGPAFPRFDALVHVSSHRSRPSDQLGIHIRHSVATAA